MEKRNVVESGRTPAGQDKLASALDDHLGTDKFSEFDAKESSDAKHRSDDRDSVRGGICKGV